MPNHKALTPDDLSRIGIALYGEYWQTPLARYLKVADRTVRRWFAGENAIPDTLPDELVVLCREHAAKLQRLAKQLG